MTWPWAMVIATSIVSATALGAWIAYLKVRYTDDAED